MGKFNIQSMTGFGRAQAETPIGLISAELRTVNNRFQDVGVALPRELGSMESALRTLLKQEIPRGKIDVRIRYTALESQQPRVTLNIGLAHEYLNQLKQLQEMGASGDIPIEVLTGLPGVLDVAPAELDEQVVWEALRGVVMQAITALNQERGREGQALGEQLDDLVRQLRGLVDAVDQCRDEVLAKFRERLAARITELEAETKNPLEPGRLEMEVALFADRSDISEELVRLRAHLDRFESLLCNENGGPVGKNMDFLTQELGRETNTTSAKVRDTTVVGYTLEMRGIIERIREQVQNIQ